jgi:hypothetical protein
VKRSRLVPALVIGASLVLLYAVFRAGSPSTPLRLPQALDTRPTTFSADPAGTRALFLVLSHFLPGARRWLRPMESLAPPDGQTATTLLVMQPTVKLRDAEEMSLDRWVYQGGQLIIATSGPWPIEGKSRDYLSRHDFRMGYPSTQVRSYAGEGGTLDLAAASLGGYELEPLFSGPSGVAGVLQQYGEGRIIVISDGAAWSNQRLRESNNAAWLVLIAGTWKNGRLAVDEYHLGNSGGRSTLQLMLAFLGTSWGLGVLQLGLAAALHLLARVRHFGPARDLPRERVQDPLQRVRGIGAFLRAARAREFAAQTIAQLAAARRYTLDKEQQR